MAGSTGRAGAVGRGAVAAADIAISPCRRTGMPTRRRGGMSIRRP